ncbi:MAG: alanine--tRNA ligase [bacterium]
MTSNEIREKFIQFFEGKKHIAIPSYPVVPQNDPSVLFTTAGMHPLVPYLMGEAHPLGKRIVNSQICLRTNDIDEVGDTAHLTFFEMLGYWSLGDYFKKESIQYTFDFYTKILGFDREKISVTVFSGDDDAPFDQESYSVWRNDIGIPEKRIYKNDKKENWWGPASETGPCGPDTEMFLDTGQKNCGKECSPVCDCGKYIEIGNNVFMEYFKNAEGKYEKLAQKNVDVGIGLERQVMFSQGKESVFETDLFEPIVSKIKELATDCSDKKIKSVRIVADHLRAATFVLAEQIEPSNIDRGYIARRLIRRAIRHGRNLGIEGNFTSQIAREVIEKMYLVYPKLKKNENFIYAEFEKEEDKFRKTLEKGLRKFNQIILDKNLRIISGKDAFDLFQSYGFPVEITAELAKEKNIRVDKEGFANEFRKHQDLSRLGAEQKFKGGLGDQSEQTIKYHTAAHLMLEALRRILGPHVSQRGANITQERIRFDFSHPDKMTDLQIKSVEEMVNDKINSKLPVVKTITTVEEAKGNGATGVFDSKYGEKVKVYTIGGDLYSTDGFSKEICGGPHVENTANLGHFRITKEESSSAGVRRIKAVLE